MLTLEEGAFFRGRYLILGGLLAPLDNLSAEHLELDRLTSRLAEGRVREVILALGATVEAETTGALIRGLINRRFPEVLVTRLAQGFRSGPRSSSWIVKPCVSPCNTAGSALNAALRLCGPVSRSSASSVPGLRRRATGRGCGRNGSSPEQTACVPSG